MVNQKWSLTKSVERRITSDWHQEFPSLGMHTLRHLLRRVGPLVVGICLERDSSGVQYKPLFHVHSLTKPFPVVSLTMSEPLRSKRTGGQQAIHLRDHADCYKDAAARLSQHARLPLAGNLSLTQVVEAYIEYMSTPLGKACRVGLARDIVGLYLWKGEVRKAESFLRGFVETVTLKDFNSQSQYDEFERSCGELLDSPHQVANTVESQIEALRLAKLPVSDLI